MGIADRVPAGKLRQRVGVCTVTQKAMRRQRTDVRKCGASLSETRAICRAHADTQEPHLRRCARVELRQGAEPSVCRLMPFVRLPSTSREEIDIEEVAHSSSLRMALMAADVIGGAPSGAT